MPARSAPISRRDDAKQKDLPPETIASANAIANPDVEAAQAGRRIDAGNSVNPTVPISSSGGAWR